MGIEQRIDFMTPLQALFQRMGDGLKGALPTDAKVKIELETTPLQDVEASIQRTKDNAPESASSKLAEQDPFGKKGSDASEEYDRASKRIEAIASRLSYLMGKIESGKDATGNAAQEVERLKDSLEKVAQRGRDAAKALGDEGLASKINEAEAAAGQGRKGGDAGASAGDIMGILRNPEGAMKQGVEMAVQKLMGGGFMNTAVGAALGMTAAVAGGLYAGWKINDRLTNEATSDAGRAVSDAMLSTGLGSKFDFRGSLFDEKRFGPKHQTEDGNSLSNQEVRSALRGMGIGLDNWKPLFAKESLGDSVANSAMNQARYAYSMGVSTEQVSGMVGAGIRSGAFSASELQVNKYLQEIAGATAEAAKQGISSNEKLGVIASLNQRTVSQTGMLTAASSHLNLQASAAMDATGQAALKGQLGMGAISTLAGSGSDESKAREVGLMLDSDGNLLPEYQKMVDANPYLKAMQGDMGSSYVALALLDDEQVRAAVNQRGIRRMVGAGASPMLAGRLMGVKSGSLSKDAVGVYGAALQGNDILSQSIATANDIDPNSARGKEMIAARGAVWSGGQREEVRKTGYDYDSAKNLNEAAAKLNAAADNLGRWLSDGTYANVLGASPLGGFGLFNRALHN